MESLGIGIEVAKQVPALAVLCLLCWLFLKQLSESRNASSKELAESRKAFIDTIKEMNAENLKAREESREVIRENTSAAKENNLALQQLTLAVGALEQETRNNGRERFK